MTSTGWNPWKMTAIGLGLVVVTALITGVVVANRSGYEGTQKGGTSAATTKTRAAEVAPAAVVAPPLGQADGGSGAGKGAVIGEVFGAGGGALDDVNENRKPDERYRVAYASCMRSCGYAS